MSVDVSLLNNDDVVSPAPQPDRHSLHNTVCGGDVHEDNRIWVRLRRRFVSAWPRIGSVEPRGFCGRYLRPARACEVI